MGKMKNLTLILLIFLSLTLVSSLNVDFSCPQEVKPSEEFTCSIDFSGNYDVKVDLLCNQDRCGEILNKDTWTSTYYFLEDFKDNKIHLKITENYEGDCNGLLKLRKTGKTGFDYEEDFTIKIQNFQTTPITNENTKTTTLNSNILLNNEEENKIIYKSKNQKIREYAIYFFAGFLILIIIFLIILR